MGLPMRTQHVSSGNPDSRFFAFHSGAWTWSCATCLKLPFEWVNLGVAVCLAAVDNTLGKVSCQLVL
eukprot:s871_g20.t1